jgi:putative transposase
MSTYFKNKYRTTSTRLPDFNYGSGGDYFLIICARRRELFFGEIENDEVVLSQEGKIAEMYWREIPERFPNVILDEFVIMPNHIHGILTIDSSLQSRDAINRVSTEVNKTGGVTGECNPMIKKGSLPFVIRWFKGRTSFEIRKINLDFEWQSRYYDHIIKDQKSFLNIQDYIRENPYKWVEDENNPDSIKNII